MEIVKKHKFVINNGLTFYFIKGKIDGRWVSDSKYGFTFRYGEKLSDSELKDKCVYFLYRNLFNVANFFKRFSCGKNIKDEFIENERCKFQRTLDLSK